MPATERFRRLDPAKQEAVLDAARREFSRRGFDDANTNRIAREAQISVGSLYQYFPTKQDLFLDVVARMARKLRDRVEELVTSPGTVLDKIALILALVQETSRTERRDVELYHELTAAGNRSLAREVSRELEGYTAGAYTGLIAEGQRRGEVRTDVPAPMLAFLVDNLFVSLQYAQACAYFADRAELYLGEGAMADDEAVVAQVLAFLTPALKGASA